MAPRRLSDSEKQDLVGRYKAGVSTSALAEAFGCSPNTVSRTVKALLPADAYAALKASRQKGLATPPPPTVTQPEEPEVDSLKEVDSSLALDDADDFGELLLRVFAEVIRVIQRQAAVDFLEGVNLWFFRLSDGWRRRGGQPLSLIHI